MQKLLFAYDNASLITPHLAVSGEGYKHHIPNIRKKPMAAFQTLMGIVANATCVVAEFNTIFST